MKTDLDMYSKYCILVLYMSCFQDEHGESALNKRQEHREGQTTPPHTHITMTVSSTQSSCDHTQKTVFYACNNTNEYTYTVCCFPHCVIVQYVLVSSVELDKIL